MLESSLSAYKTLFLYAERPAAMSSKKAKNDMQMKREKCSAVSEFIMPETNMEGDIEFTFFLCPECGKVYPVCVTDSSLRADITEYARMRNLIRVKPVKEPLSAEQRL